MREGECLSALSGILYLAGEGELAQQHAEAAVRVLESVEPQGHELALARAVLAQRLAVAGHDDAAARASAHRAFELAERLGDEPVAVHALTTEGSWRSTCRMRRAGRWWRRV